MTQQTTERPARPGETCTCGRPATLVYFTAQFGEVPYCGAQHPADEDESTCSVAWCQDHDVTAHHIRHRALVGTVDAVDKDWPLRVRLIYNEGKDGTGDLGPTVAVHWEEPPMVDPVWEDTGGRPVKAGLDLDALDALVLAELLVRATRLLADGTRS